MPILMNPSTITLAEAKTSVLRFAGRQNDADQQDAAGEHIRDSLSTLNLMRVWSWLGNSTNATITATTGVLSLTSISSTINKIHVVYVPGVGPLDYIPQRNWLRENPLLESVGGMSYYTTFTLANTTNLLVADAPSTDTLATIYYSRYLSMPASATVTFDVPSPVMDYVLNEARARYAAETGADFTFWQGKANKCLAALIIDDEKKPDAEYRFKSGYLNPHDQSMIFGDD